MLPSVKFTQSKTVLRNSLKESRNDSLKDLWKSSSSDTNIQYDLFKFTKEVLQDFRSNQEVRLQHHLTSQGFFYSNLIKHSCIVICQLYLVVCPVFPYPRTFTILPFNFATSPTPLPHVNNRTMWGLSQSPDCSFCLNPESLLHTVSLVDHLTWSHDSTLDLFA